MVKGNLNLGAVEIAPTIEPLEQILIDGDGIGAGDALEHYSIPKTFQEAYAAGWNRRHILAAVQIAEMRGLVPPVLPAREKPSGQGAPRDRVLEDLSSDIAAAVDVLVEVGGIHKERYLDTNEVIAVNEALKFVMDSRSMTADQKLAQVPKYSDTPVHPHQIFLAIRSAPGAFATSRLHADTGKMQLLVRDIERCGKIFLVNRQRERAPLNEAEHVLLYQAMDQALEALETPPSLLRLAVAQRFVKTVVDEFKDPFGVAIGEGLETFPSSHADDATHLRGHETLTDYVERRAWYNFLALVGPLSNTASSDLNRHILNEVLESISAEIRNDPNSKLIDYAEFERYLHKQKTHGQVPSTETETRQPTNGAVIWGESTSPDLYR